jgi:hypothetical protein
LTIKLTPHTESVLQTPTCTLSHMRTCILLPVRYSVVKDRAAGTVPANSSRRISPPRGRCDWRGTDCE